MDGRWARMTPQEAEKRVEELETVVGMLYVALSKFAQPRQWFRRGVEVVYLVTEQEQQEARRARMVALRIMADVGATLPAINFSVPSVPIYPPRPSNGPRSTSPFLQGLDEGSDPRTPTPTRPR